MVDTQILRICAYSVSVQVRSPLLLLKGLHMNKKKSHKKKRTKDSCEIIHFKNRMYERQGIVLNKEQINYISKLIQTGNSIFVKKQTNRIVIHDINYNDKTLRIVYDKLRKLPVTVYDDSWLE